ncbi:MAG TPA: hypothetical protein VFA92_07800 [Candidatus Binatia bacterium]|nr:hypothetical protein [Candidatus Binatia bacterium]
MTGTLQLVFSTPPARIEEAAFHEWYDFHLTEILATRGFLAARRFAVRPVTGSEPPAGFRHLSAYETEGSPEELGAALREQLPAMRLPEWFGEIRFASWNCFPLDGLAEPSLVEHAYLVFSRPPAGTSFEELSRWYEDHVAENLQVAGLVAGRRFRVEEARPRGDAGSAIGEAPAPRHLALYEAAEPIEEVRAALARATAEGGIAPPDWFPRISFTSLDCVALSGRVVAAEVRRAPE